MSCMLLWSWISLQMFYVSEIADKGMPRLWCTESCLVVSIPILLLWSVKINLRRKIGLGSLLCLSIFAIITNIIRASGHKLKNGQDDVAWVLFWLEMEACVALIANSMTAFRSLFAASTSRIKNSPQPQKEPAELRMGNRKLPPHVDLPTLPTAKISGLRSMMLQDPFEDRETTDSDSTLNGSGVHVIKSFDATSSHQNQSAHRVSVPSPLSPASFYIPRIPTKKTIISS